MLHPPPPPDKIPVISEAVARLPASAARTASSSMPPGRARRRLRGPKPPVSRRPRAEKFSPGTSRETTTRSWKSATHPEVGVAAAAANSRSCCRWWTRTAAVLLSARKHRVRSWPSQPVRQSPCSARTWTVPDHPSTPGSERHRRLPTDRR